MQGKHNSHVRSNRQHRWSEKKLVTSHGYVRIRVGKSHPLADANGYAYERLLVWVSAGNPRPLKGEELRVKNGVQTDNRLENIQLITRAERNRLQNQKLVRCSVTGTLHPCDELPEVSR